MEKWINLKNYLYPGDEFLEEKGYCVYFKDLADYIKSDLFGIPNDKKLHTGLKPIPFVGDLEKTKIYYLSLNPGLGVSDYDQDRRPECEERYFDNINQKANREYPFYMLDPILCAHGGYIYWSKKLNPLINLVKKQEKVSWLEAQKKVSQVFAVIELVPYHSKKFGLSNAVIDKMASVKDIKLYVKNKVIPKAKKGEAIVIVTRKNDKWNIAEGENIIIYRGSETRAANIGERTRAFNAIKNILNYE